MNTLFLKHSVKTFFLLFLLFASAALTAQTDTGKFLPNITPPSPVAGELGKFGNVPVGLFTGTANISVPLLSFKTKDLESPLSLFYGSNGIKVDEVASNVGLGWNLNLGGVITRTVRDQQDEPITAIYPPDDLPNATNEQRQQFYKAAGQGNADTESDIYSFNFNGISGKFVYDKNGVPVFINNQKIKIEKTGTGNADFLVTTTNGVKYYFTEKETTAFRNMGAGHSVISGSVTAWYLTKIVHPNKSEVSFAYEETGMDYTASNSQTFTMAYPQIQEDCNGGIYSSAPVLSGIVAYNMTVIGKRITKIYSNNATDGYVTISYSAAGVNEEVEGNSKIESISQYNAENILIEKISFSYLKTANTRVFLQNITFLDPTKKYAFEYINATGFPARLSRSQDHWGYYNGKTNTNLVPKNITEYDLNDLDYNGADKEPDVNFAKTGLLSKVVYPTKGYTELEYESNTYWGPKTTYPAKKVDQYRRIPEDTSDLPEIYTLTSAIDQKIVFTGYVTYVRNGPPLAEGESDPYDTGHDIASVKVACVDTPDPLCPKFYINSRFGPIYDSIFTFIRRQTNTFYLDAKAGKTYKLYFSKGGLRTNATLAVAYYPTAPVVTYTNLETGGVRIKTTKDFADASARASYKRYYYGPKDDINHSSGDKGNNAFYTDIFKQRRMCSGGGGLGICQFVDNTFLTISSSSIISLFDTGSSNCFYKYVTVSEGGDNFENGGESKEFIVHRDAIGSPILGDLIKSTPLTNFGWDNGLEIKSQVLQKKQTGLPFVVVQENENKYTLDPAYSKEIKSYNVRKNFEEPCALAQYVENLSIVEYKTKGYWFYVESSITRSYDLKGLNPVETTTTYQYNNPTHIQLTSQSTKSSLKETLETKYYYPQDAVMASEPQVSEMISTNRIDTPLKTEVFRAGVKQSEQKTEYAKDATTSNLLLPKFIYAAKFPNALPGNALEKKITYDKYDDMGNILQYTLESGMPVAIIWGYNKTKPIAKVENATYDQALAAYSVSDPTFRANLPNALITTYSYKPLVGITTITDPKGFVTTYDYDTYNRLKTVKDNLGNVLSENQYHYKN
ncbi:hypothetical protein D0817_16595 [Flavobacterium cupreum]|uniref:RHS repeat protein n=1 Tax=Flavobacterium cupreum TaxID=2133766 RepID=A0A434A4X4_9FLAO|nr:RHS repeat domain-containing protein [Flavobacterium cupreum]RUT69453.1 hypothetical protein D0817_16595 [Flavobacterium cupreum]